MGYRPPVIFVLGSQRSGTNVLRRSLSLDPRVQGFNERKHDALYRGWQLRPESEIRSVLLRQRNVVLLKPIQSVIRRPVADLLTEFDRYDVRVVWIYRDPVAVFRSRARRWPYKADSGPFVEEWNRVNRSALDALDERMAVVCYEHLSADDSAFYTLSTWLGIRGENLFAPVRPTLESDLSVSEVADIREGTAESLARLDDAALAFLAEQLPSPRGESEIEGGSTRLGVLPVLAALAAFIG